MNLILQPVRKKIKELTAIAEWRNKTLISLRTTKPTSIDYSIQCEWIDSIDKKYKAYFFLYDHITFIGYTGLDKINKINRTAELSLLIGQPYQNKGYGKETVFHILKYAFVFLHLNCVFIEVYLTTSYWSDFWSKMGFKQEGVLRMRKFWEGYYYDSIIASISEKEFIKFYEKRLST